ncbi:MAG: hypothetical protein JW700_01045 [Candidatus Aenigmarchaeota archaeon]|nr:hypothetical protein [Candidatus Aenigmarchaeota archaeon]
MREFWLHILVLLIVLASLAYFIPYGITGMTMHQLDVAIKSNFSGHISAFNFETLANVSETQDIYVEFFNSGTETYDLTIEEYIYYYSDKLEELVHYQDSTVTLYPGMRRPFETKFTPNTMGYYYIKVRITMGTKRMEAWGSFYATFPDYTPYVYAQNFPFGTWAEVTPSLNVSYPESINVYPGRSVMTNIKVKNIGNATIHEMKMHLSASNLLDIDMNPKESYYLDPGETVVFLLDIFAPNEAPIGEYPIDFELVTRELKETGTIKVNLTSYDVSLKDDVKNTILNYDLLIADLERQIIDARAKDLDTTEVGIELENAKAKMQEAKNFYEQEDYLSASSSLEELKDILKDATLKLAQISFVVYTAPSFSPLWLLLVIIAIAVIFLMLHNRKKDKRKPKLLRMEEAET